MPNRMAAALNGACLCLAMAASLPLHGWQSNRAPSTGTAVQPAGSIAMDTTHVARSMRPGEIVTLIVTASTPLESTSLVAFGRTLPMWTRNDGRQWTGLVGLDVDLEPGVYTLKVQGRTRDGRTIEDDHRLKVTARRFAERHLRVDPRFSSPPPEVQPRIAREAARLEQLFGTVTEAAAPDVPFTRPVPQPTNSPFGSRSFFNKQPRGRHNGVDFPSPAGTEIRNPAPGRIVLVDDLYFTGHTVIVDHGYGLYSLFAHMEKTAAAEGEAAARGAILGWVGASGRATGPHLHWSVRLNAMRVDPTSLLSSTPSGRPAAP